MIVGSIHTAVSGCGGAGNVIFDVSALCLQVSVKAPGKKKVA